MDTFVFPNFGTSVLGIDNKRNDRTRANMMVYFLYNRSDIPSPTRNGKFLFKYIIYHTPNNNSPPFSSGKDK